MRLLATLILSLPLIACGPPTPAGDGGGGGGGGGAGSVDAAMQTFVRGVCDLVVSCSDSAQGAITREMMFAFGADQLVHMLSNAEACRSMMASSANFDVLLGAGRVTVDPSKVNACIASLAGDCAMDNMESGACSEFLKPTRQEGESCGSDEECTTNRCSAEKGQCGACILHAQIGEACTSSDDCVTGANCERSQCAANPEKVATGQACEGGILESSEWCANPNDLCVDGACTTVSLAAAGQPCGDTANGPVLCGDGGLCINDVCVTEAVANGQVCQVPDGEDDTKRAALCGLGSRCDHDTSNCVARFSAGEACESDAECAEGNYCDNEVCTAKKANGEACSQEDECQSAACVADACVTSVAETCD